MSLRQLKFKPIVKNVSCLNKDQIFKLNTGYVREETPTDVSSECLAICNKATSTHLKASTIGLKENPLLQPKIVPVIKYKNERSVIKRGLNGRVTTNSLNNNITTMINTKQNRKRTIESEHSKLPCQNKSDRSKISILELVSTSSKALGQKQSLKSEKEEIIVIEDEDTCEKTTEEGSKTSTEGELVPQVKLSPNGVIRLDEESLSVEPSKKKPCYSRKSCEEKSDIRDWCYDDTILFYKALSAIGADFETMTMFFPRRSRSNLKRKFKREERKHGELIDKILSTNTEYDLQSALDELQDEFTIKCLGKNLISTNNLGNEKEENGDSLSRSKASSKDLF